MQLQFTVRGQQIFRVDKTPLASDSRLYIAGAVSFDSEWDDITAVYLNFEPRNGTAITAVLTDGAFDESIGVSLSAGTWRVSAHGSNTAGKEIHTTPVLLNVAQAGGRDGEAPPYVPPDAAGQIAAVAEEARRVAIESADSAKNSADAAKASEKSAAEQAKNAAQSSADALASERNAKTSETNAKASEDNAANSAAEALDSANQANVSAEQSGENAEVAKTAAETAVKSADNAAKDAELASESKDTALEAANRAEQAMIKNGYAEFYIENGRLNLVRTTNIVDMLNFEINNGRLEALING